LLFAAAYKLGNRDTTALNHSIREQSVRLLAAFIGTEVVGAFEVDRINSGKRDQLFKINAAVGFGLRLSNSSSVIRTY
jgi:hypothetical protein